MKWIIFIILILTGCKEADMGTSAKEYTLTLVDGSSNVTDDTPVYDSDASYVGGEIVQQGDNIYQVLIVPITEDNWFLLSACHIGVYVGIPNGKRLAEWDGVSLDTSTNCWTSTNKQTDYAFTKTSSEADKYSTYTVNIKIYSLDIMTGEITGLDSETNRDVKIFQNFNDCFVGEWFVHDGELIEKWSGGATKHDLREVRKINKFLPFDPRSNTVAVRNSSMSMTGEVTHRFNSFGLANVIAETLTYTIYDLNDAVVVPETVLTLDCWQDDDHLYDQAGITVLIPVGSVVEAGGTIAITLDNATRDTQLGNFSSNVAIDEGKTDAGITMSVIDFNSYDADDWGQIPEATKPIVGQINMKIYGEYSKASRAHARHRNLQGQFLTFDATDIYKKTNEYSIQAFVKRGIIFVGETRTVVVDGKPETYLEYNITVQEVV